MPLFVSALLGGFLQLMGSFLGRALLSLGLGFVQFLGFNSLITYTMTQIKQNMGALSGSMSAWAGLLQLDTDISIIISAIGVKVALKALGSDRITRLVSKGA